MLDHDGSNALRLEELIDSIQVPDLCVTPEVLSAAHSAVAEVKDIFAEEKRKHWKEANAAEARCDFTRRVRLTHRGNVWFVSPWQKSVYGRTLTDIKADDTMVEFFADNLAPLMREVLGEWLNRGDWCIVTTPKRRHLVKNFATQISEAIALQLNIPFYEDVALCHSKHRIGAVFSLNVLPKEQNIIVFDDFVTTGSTLQSMQVLLRQYEKNVVCFAGINNSM